MREFIDGAEAIARAALHAGCTFFAGYPITPATPILLHLMRELPKVGGVAIQGEDEIASISLCIAASMAGKKAMTATSGPGISLYSENIGLAIMGEVPLVVVDVQRMGPATGAATTGAQGDVQFVRWATSGGLPMVVLVPSSIESIFSLTVHAFNVAERLRTPVFLLTSKDMILSMHTLDRSRLALPEPISRTCFAGTGDYVPYRFDDLSDIPDFLPIGGPKPVRFTTSTHDEHGFLTKARPKIDRLNRHLEAKIIENRASLEFTYADIEEGAETLLVAYGVNAPVCRELVGDVRNAGGRCSLLVVETLYPVPTDALRSALDGVRRVVLPELNCGLYAESMRAVLPSGVELVSVTKVDGDPLSASEIRTRGGLM